MEELQKIIEEQKAEINELKERLAKYTNPKRNKKYYETHKEEIVVKAREYNKTRPKIPKEKIKEYNKRYYEKKKQKQSSEDIPA